LVELPEFACFGYPSDMNSKGIRIACCPPDDRAEALRMLHDGLPSDQQSVLVHALDGLRGQDESAFAGLLVATDGERLVGVVWVQLAAGQTAVLWPPNAEGAAAIELMHASAEFLDKCQVALAQTLVNPDAHKLAELLATGGMEKLAQLAYLSADRDAFPHRKPAGDLHFEPRASDHPDRLGTLLLSTYENSQDCPAIDGVREPGDILAGYAGQGVFSAENWFFVQAEDRVVGVLILSLHANGEACELVYMGIDPQERGKGWGRQIVEFALWQAHQLGADRLVLAVDEENSPAVKMYQDAGLVVWDRRTVFGRLLGGEG